MSLSYPLSFIKSSIYLFKIFYTLLCVHMIRVSMDMYTCVPVHVPKSEHDLQESVLSFHDEFQE